MYWEPDKECMDREELEQLQLERLQSTLNRVYAHVPFYRKKFDALGISPEEIGSLSDLPRLPFTTKEDVTRELPLRAVRGPASGGRPHPRLVRHDGDVVGRGLHAQRHHDVEQAGGPHPRRRRGDQGRRRAGLVPATACSRGGSGCTTARSGSAPR